MNLIQDQFYHICNRTNNEEALFRGDENYIYFLQKYRYYLDEYFETIAYCLMPTHFHILVRMKSAEITKTKTALATLLSSYTKAYNKRYNRHGSLFQPRTKAINITDEKHLITLLIYIHQNPIRTGLVNKAEEWKYSSYQDYIEIRKGSLPSKQLVANYYQTTNNFKKHSEEMIPLMSDI